MNIFILRDISIKLIIIITFSNVVSRNLLHSRREQGLSFLCQLEQMTQCDQALKC